MSDPPNPGLLKSSTLRTAVLAALLVWAPGAVLISLHHRDFSDYLLRQAAGDLEGLAEEVVDVAHAHRFVDLEDDLGEPLEGLEEIDGEEPFDFLARYAERIREEQRTRGDDLGLRLRLALLGEGGEGSDDALAVAPLEALSELMETEVPDAFHETLEELLEQHFEARQEAGEEEEEGTEFSAEELVAAIEDSEMLEEFEVCILAEDPAGRLLLSSSEEVVSTVEIGRRFTVVQLAGRTGGARLAGAAPLEDRPETLEPWCLIERRLRPAGGGLLIGTRIDDSYRSIRRSAARRNLLLALGLPLAFAAGWLQSRPIERFLTALSSAATRQDRGEVGARLQISPEGRDLALAVDTVNRMLGRLDQTVQGLSRVSDSIAHDLRTPLSRLQGQLDLLKRSSDPPDELIEAVQQEADQLLETFNALLRIAQVESGVRKQGFREVDLAEIVHNVAELYSPVFAEKGVAFAVNLPRRRVGYRGDRDLWLQALSNLVENALKYTPAGGRVDLELDGAGTRPRIRLADSGPGIPESERDNVFRRFYRLDRHRGERGSGLGLSLVGAVCDLHRAEITLSGDRGLVVDIEL